MRIAICDDEVADREIIRRFIITHHDSHEIKEYSSAIQLLECINANCFFDLIFLDIQMPDSSGWEVSAYLKRTHPNIYISLVSINTNYIHDCFDRTDWFATKPVSEARIHKILDKATDKLFPVLLEFVINKVTVILSPSEIMYVEVRRNDVYIHTADAVHKMRESLSNIAKQFDIPSFTATHQSFLVNLKFYESIADNEIILKNGEHIPLSRNRNVEFKKALREYILKSKSYE